MERKVNVGFPGNTKELTVDVPEGLPPIWGVDAKLKVVGTDVPRLDARDKVTGKAKYAYDINLPGMLHGRILRSAYPAATITNVDVSQVHNMPGVKALVYAFDEGQIGSKVVRYAGEEILAIAADTPEHAEDAIRAVIVDYEPMEFVVDVERARSDGAPVVHPDVPNNIKPGRTRGELAKVQEKLTGAAKTIEATYKTQVQTHSCLETHGVTVKPEPDGGLTVWASTQAVFSVRDGLADALEMKPDQIHVITHYMGGGFGSKFGPRTEGVLAAKLALETKAPVKLMLNRKEEQLATGNRPSSVQQVRLGADAQGKLVGIVVKTYGTGGVGGGAGCAIPIVYKLPEDGIYKEEADVLTNAGPATAMRAPGHPQGVFAMEQAMDELAHALNLDPLEFRRINDDNPIRAEEYKIGAKEIGWERRNKTPGSGSLQGSKRRGIGMASTQWAAAGGKGSHADVEIHKNGDVVLLQGAQDLGTGFRTAMAILVAEELGIKPADVKTRVGESIFGYGPGSGGSTTTPSVAPAVHLAAFNAKKKLQEAVAPQWGVAAADIVVADGKLTAGDKSMPFRQACALLPVDKITAGGDRPDNFDGYMNSVAGVQFAEVEVDVETGEVRVVKVVAIQDAGRTINTLATESQISGAVIQSVSFALFEDRIMDKQVGHMVNPNFMEYKIAGPADCPEIVPIVFQVANGKNSVGAMGMGEPPAIPLPGAIANAVYNAIGVRIRELPITPDRVLAALAQRGATVA